MSSASSVVDDITNLNLLFMHGAEQEESEETPREDWSSLEEEVRYITAKRRLYNKGEFLPPSKEICSKYIPQSDSTVFIHPYFNYPALIDPGIKKALLKPEKHYTHPPDGQDLYIELCKKMDLAPIRMFYRSLMEEKADLKYYGLSFKMTRVIALALQYNTTVKSLNLTENFMDEDASFHIGDLLAENHYLTELNLSGCRIKAIGLNRVLAGLKVNSTLRVLNLNDNQLDDEGGVSFANAIIDGIDIVSVSLSNNNLGETTAIALANALKNFKQNKCKISHWDLSKNKLFTPTATCRLLREISLMKILKSIDLSWNALCDPQVGASISDLFRTCPKLKHLNISYNMFKEEATVSLIKHLLKAKKLQTFDLSGNPLTPADALMVLTKITFSALGVRKLLFDNVRVTSAFSELREKLLEMEGREETVITHGDVINKIDVKGPDFREVVLKRIDFLGQKPKKKKFDIAVWAMVKVFRENVDLVPPKDLAVMIAEAGLLIDDGLADSIGIAFIGKKTAKENLVSLKLLAEYAQRLWPDREMPPEEPSRTGSRRSSRRSSKKAGK